MSDEHPDWLSLDDGERIEWVGEPELASKFWELVVGVLTIPLLGLGLFIAGPAYLTVKNTDYIVTNQSLYKKEGILSKNISSLELDRIQNTEYSQSATEKLLGYGTVGVSTAGSQGIEMSFDAVGDADRVRDLVRELGKQYREPSSEPSEQAGDPAAEIAEELARTREALETVDRKISRVLAARRGEGGENGGASHADEREQR